MRFKSKLLKFVCWTLGVILLLAILIAVFCPIQVIKGHELAISETFFGVTQEEDTAREYGPCKRFYVRGYQDFTVYDMRKHRYILDDVKNVALSDRNDINGEPLYIQVDRGQSVKTRIKVIWRYKPGMLGIVHAQARNSIDVAEHKILDAPVKRIAQNLMTPQDALSVYYGEGLVKLQDEFKKRLHDDEAISSMGLVIDDAVIYTDLDSGYVKQITAKIEAEQKEKAQAQVEKANMAEARAAKASAEIAKAKVVTDAEAQKQKQILEAEAAARRQVLAAEAKKEQIVLAAQADMEKQRMEGEGLKLRKVAEAEGVLALAMAEAKGADALKKAKYDGEAGARQTSVLIAEKVAEKVVGMLKGVQVIPERAFVNVAQEMAGTGIQPVVDVKAGE